MSRWNPAVILYDANGVPLAVADDAAIPVDTRGLMVAGETPSGQAKFIGLNRMGHQRVDLFDEDTNIGALVLPSYSLATDSRVRIFGDSLVEGSLGAPSWDTTLVGSGVVGGTGETTLSTGATANSSIVVRSRVVARYLTSSTHQLVVRVRVGDTGTANNVRRWGAFDANNGYFFELSGTTLSAVTRRGGVDTKTESTSWDRSFTLDTNYHNYSIVYFGLGVIFMVDGERKLLLPDGGTATPRTNSLDFKISFENTNSSGLASNLVLAARSAAIVRFGPSLSRPRFSRINASGVTTLKAGPGALHRVVINQSGVVNSLITIYDNTTNSGTIIAAISPNTNQGSMEYNLDFSNGLTFDASLSPGDVTIVFD